MGTKQPSVRDVISFVSSLLTDLCGRLYIGTPVTEKTALVVYRGLNRILRDLVELEFSGTRADGFCLWYCAENSEWLSGCNTRRSPDAPVGTNHFNFCPYCGKAVLELNNEQRDEYLVYLAEKNTRATTQEEGKA